MSRSRVTLATIEALAMAYDRASPSTMAVCGPISISRISRPSIRAWSYGSTRRSARHIARCEARRMFNSLISVTEAAPTPTAAARTRIWSYRRSRCCSDSVFESRTPGILRQYGLTTNAAATTGPARQAIPTSSTPATRRAPSRQSAHSRASVGTIMRWSVPRVRNVLARGDARSCAGACLATIAAVAALLDARGPPSQPTQVVQLRAPHLAAASHFHLLHTWRLEHERALDAHPMRHA